MPFLTHTPSAFARSALIGFIVAVGLLSFLAAQHYPGKVLVFAGFSLLANALLLNGLRSGALFFDTFIGIFFWLGFYLKLSIRIAFFNGHFVEPIGVFDGSDAAYDKALTVVSIAFLAVLSASFLRGRVFRYPKSAAAVSSSALYRFYLDYRTALLAGFVGLIVLVAASNAWLGIYQRGMTTRTVLPLGLNGIYKWLLQFGFATISAIVIRFEIERAKGKLTPVAIGLPILESLLCNLSLLSRGMILNLGGLAAGVWRLLASLRWRPRILHLAIVCSAFVVLFAVSVFAVNYPRAAAREAAIGDLGMPVLQVAKSMAMPLFIDRWVGMEGVLAVTSAPDLGWDLWRAAWREKYDESVLSLYDTHFIESQYKDFAHKPNVHYVSLPGMVAFLFYSGSLPFVFFGMLAAALLAAVMEIACYRYCGKDWVLCSLLAQVIAFRYASFGYVPAQSYLLFGALVLNCLLIWLAHRYVPLKWRIPTSRGVSST